MFDALVVGSGPAGLSIAASLCSAGLKVVGLTPKSPTVTWPNTYGIWCDELAELGLTQLLEHRWSNCVSFAKGQEVPLNREYGLLDNDQLRTHLLTQCEQGQIKWHIGMAAEIEHFSSHSRVTTQDGTELSARIIVDASGHKPAFVERPRASQVAYQAAYGIVGTFSTPPIQPGQMVLMDWRNDHLTPAQRKEPPTFLYAMDLGDGVYFVEETSLAHAPAIPFDVLERRLYQRLDLREVQVKDIHHVEHCLFPMNLPLPVFDQPVVGFGGAASMVHPASGYLVGAMLRRAPTLTQAIVEALDEQNSSPSQTAKAAWEALWPRDRVRKHYLYLFGLNNLMQFEDAQLQNFFDTFFRLPYPSWSGYLSDTLSTPELIQAMLGLFRQAPNNVRKGLVGSIGQEGNLLWRSLTA